MDSVQFEFPMPTPSTAEHGESWLHIGERRVRLRLVSNRKARRYILRCQRDGSARLTVPRRGSVREALRFANRHLAWLEKQLLRQACEVKPPAAWQAGTGILFRGETVLLRAGAAGTIQFGSEAVPVKTVTSPRASSSTRAYSRSAGPAFSTKNAMPRPRCGPCARQRFSPA